ncbi:MAG: hypothetical protein JNJ73_04925 [Hyphomonadaceae bacterium]|nr:hypothetical protein [Hyphomonadaceae bacterium]
MLRAALGILVGVLAGMIVAALGEAAGHAIFPPPRGVGFSNPAQASAAIARLHPGAFASVLVAWGCAAFAGGLTGAFIARRGAWPAYAVAATIFALAAWTMTMIAGHPWWMWIGAVAFIGGGGYLAGRFSKA